MREHTPETGPRTIARVAVLPPIPGFETLDYLPPVDDADALRPGVRVLASVGRRRVTGIVLEVVEAVPERALRPLDAVLDREPFLPHDVLAVCAFAARHYMSSIGEALSTAVLGSLRVESARHVHRAREPAPDEKLSAVERRILERLASGAPPKTTTLVRDLGSSGLYDALGSLERRGLVVVDEAAKPRTRVRVERFATIVRVPTEDEAAALERRSPVQRAALAKVADAGPDGLGTRGLSKSERGAVTALERRGLIAIEERESLRRPGIGDGSTLPPRPPAEPTETQRAALDAIERARVERRFAAFLLHGVTGSGKTEVYLRAAERALDDGRGVLVLVPEIALTHQVVEAAAARFGSRVALLHSGLSEGERADEWRRLRRGEARIAVGVRSAVFAPVPDLGLIVVDEEHDGSYKQDGSHKLGEGLRYNARDLAVVRARDAACPVVLGSATPSIESWHNAAIGRYEKLELPGRIADRPLPVIELVDLRDDPPAGLPPLFATRVREALKDNARAGGQSLVFLNRRGFANFLQCRACGEAIGCPSCSVTLTLHKTSRSLRCHHCDHRQPVPDVCPRCRGEELADLGAGTERVEEALASILPDARVARLDRDTIAKKGALAALLGQWRRAEIDVLVGTQIVAKGHDVPGVTLVVVVNADQLLCLPDFRAAERTFQLLTQVAGRAGRGDRPGRVLVQSYQPEHYAMTLAATQDFLGLATRELASREALRYPPFSRVAHVQVDGPDPARVAEVAERIAEGIRAASARLPEDRRVEVLGPAPSPIERLRGRWRRQCLVKSPDAPALRAAVGPAVTAARSEPGVRIALDVDPYGA